MRTSRWKLVAALIVYVGVAAGGYAYFAAQNPTTQLARVADMPTLIGVQQGMSDFLKETARGYVYDGLKETEIPDEFGGLKVTDRAKVDGAKQLDRLFLEIDSAREEDIEQWGAPGGITSVHVGEDDFYTISPRIRPLPGRQAGIVGQVSVTIEYYDGDNRQGAGTYTELGMTVDGATQTITAIVNPMEKGW